MLASRPVARLRGDSRRLAPLSLALMTNNANVAELQGRSREYGSMPGHCPAAGLAAVPDLESTRTTSCRSRVSRRIRQPRTRHTPSARPGE